VVTAGAELVEAERGGKRRLAVAAREAEQTDLVDAFAATVAPVELAQKLLLEGRQPERLARIGAGSVAQEAREEGDKPREVITLECLQHRQRPAHNL
jgi:hypothetical protein